MVMIKEIEHVDETTITTSFLIEEENIFNHNGFFREPGLIENIAQTAAARVGYLCKQQNKKVPLGFIGAIKNLIIHRIPETGEWLKTKVTIEHEVMNATVISGKIYSGEHLIAETEMNIFIQEEGKDDQVKASEH
jgi:predicted hotdog family 3-hydroxylacyl-ACP dehydratase